MILEALLIAAFLASLVVCSVLFFDRDPERVIPTDPRVIVSPADGRVVYVRRIDADEIPWSLKGRKRINLIELTKADFGVGKGTILGIYMSPFDVHVNRAPISGQVERISRFEGSLMRMRNPTFELVNRRAITAIRHSLGFMVVVVQIGVFAVGRIENFVTEGTEIQLGGRIGRIRLGSQVDLILPDLAGLNLMAKEGQHVLAGTSVIARF